MGALREERSRFQEYVSKVLFVELPLNFNITYERARERHEHFRGNRVKHDGDNERRGRNVCVGKTSRAKERRRKRDRCRKTSEEKRKNTRRFVKHVGRVSRCAEKPSQRCKSINGYIMSRAIVSRRLRAYRSTLSRVGTVVSIVRNNTVVSETKFDGSLDAVKRTFENTTFNTCQPVRARYWFFRNDCCESAAPRVVFSYKTTLPHFRVA